MQYFPPDHPAFDHRGSRRRDERSAQDLEERFAWLALVSAELLRAVGGCAKTRDLLLRFFDRQITCRELAAAWGVDPSTAWRRVRAWAEEFRWVRAADLAVSRLTQGAGFVVDTQRGVLVDGGGYAVPLEGKGVILPPRLPVHKSLTAYLRSNARLLGRKAPPKVFFTGWPNGGGFNLHLSEILADLAGAVDCATNWGQRSVFDIAGGRVIPVDGVRRRAA